MPYRGKSHLSKLAAVIGMYNLKHYFANLWAFDLHPLHVAHGCTLFYMRVREL